MTNFPAINERLGLGLGIDMPWSKSGSGFRTTAGKPDTIPAELIKFLHSYRHLFNYTFIAFQPKNRNILDASDYFDAYSLFFEAAELNRKLPRVFHQTILNLGAVEKYDKRPICDFTNKLIKNFGFSWILEDLGIWSVRGKSLPYPLPPFLTVGGLAACINNIKEYMKMLDAPICVEFPGFTEGVSFHIGTMHAFDYFRAIAEETECAVTLDIGHLLSYQWLLKRTQTADLIDYERLPLASCHELHLSGCKIMNGKFRDLHNGILLDEQIDLLQYLLPRCPNLKAVTYEDPRFLHDGSLVPKSVYNFNRMVAIVREWRGQ